MTLTKKEQEVYNTLVKIYVEHEADLKRDIHDFKVKYKEATQLSLQERWEAQQKAEQSRSEKVAHYLQPAVDYINNWGLSVQVTEEDIKSPTLTPSMHILKNEIFGLSTPVGNAQGLVTWVYVLGVNIENASVHESPYQRRYINNGTLTPYVSPDDIKAIDIAKRADGTRTIADDLEDIHNLLNSLHTVSEPDVPFSE